VQSNTLFDEMNMENRSLAHSEPIDSVGEVAELFAGVGGFRLGLARAGFRTVYSNQWEPSTKAQHASDVYVAQFGPEGHSNQDIATVEEIPRNFDLLVGGFPCQDYSVAKSLSSSTGLEGKKGVLWWEILRLVMKHQPKFVFLENVDRLLKSPSSQRGRDFAVMLSSLGKAGYVVEWRVVNAADYGFPQRRIRVFIVATKKAFYPSTDSPSQYIFDSGVLAQALPVVADSQDLVEIGIDDDPELVSREFGKGRAKSVFENSGLFLEGIAYTVKSQALYEGAKTTLGDVLEPDEDVPEQYWISDSKLPEWIFLKGAKNIERTHKDSGFKYRYSEGKMSFPDSLEKASRTILTGEGGSTPSRFKHAVKTHGGLRRLTPLELERLSGFPDGWTAPGTLDYKITDGRRAFFIGNALVVGLIERVGRVLAKRV
jgi:DNA (cytosine-5)-methyltransferase 1